MEAKDNVDRAQEAKDTITRQRARVVPERIEDLGVGDEEETIDELTEQFGDTDTADKAAMEAEKADPDDKRNEP